MAFSKYPNQLETSPARNEHRKIFHRETGRLPDSSRVLDGQSEPILDESFLLPAGSIGAAIRWIPESRFNQGIETTTDNGAH